MSVEARNLFSPDRKVLNLLSTYAEQPEVNKSDGGFGTVAKQFSNLSKVEAAKLLKQMDRHWRKFRLFTLANDFTIQHVLILMERTIEEYRSPGYYFNTNKDERVCYAYLKANALTVKNLLRLNRLDFALAINKKRPIKERRDAWQRLVRRRIHAVRLIEEVPVREKFLKKPLDEIKIISDEIKQLKKSLDLARVQDNKAKEKLIKADLFQLMLKVGESAKTLSSLEEKATCAGIKLNEGREIYIYSFLRFVQWRTRPWLGKELDTQDLLQNACIGMMQALAKFDRTRGFAFTTYASWYIRATLNHAVTRSKRDRVMETLLDVTLDDGSGETYSQQIVDSSAKNNSENIIQNSDLEERLKAVLKTLLYREREIIKLRYGLGGNLENSYEEIGHIFKVGPVRIRQIEAKAIRKLRQPSRKKELEMFFE